MYTLSEYKQFSEVKQIEYIYPQLTYKTLCSLIKELKFCIRIPKSWGQHGKLVQLCMVTHSI